MKKNLIALYTKIILAIGAPIICVATAIAVFSNDSQVNQDEVHIIEIEQDVSEELMVEAPTKPEPIEPTEPKAPTKPAPIEPTEPKAPTEPAPTISEPIEPTEPKAPTEPAPTQPTAPTTGAVNSNNHEVKYTYDLLGRVIKAEYELYLLEYIYDRNGNILKINKILK